jgi:hypothetical protein
MAEAAQDQLLVRFRGICGHIDLQERENGKGKEKKKRTVLVRHRNGNSGIEHHVPYVEFYADDIESFPPEVNVVQYSRPGVDGRFARIDFDRPTEIRLKGKEPGWVVEEPSYKRGVPHMSEVVRSPQIASGLKDTVEKIDTSRAAAVFDMPDGRLLAGEPEAMITRFEKSVGFEERRLARWVDLYVEFTPPLVLELVPLQRPGRTHEIRFKKSLRMITIGNEPERLILGLLQTTEEFMRAIGHGAQHNADASPIQPTGHYVLYYDLLETVPSVKPVPVPTLLTGAGCPNNNLP